MNIKQFEELTGTKIHYQFNRDLAHFDEYLTKILECVKNKEQFYLAALYCPTKSSLNLDDINMFLILKWLQDALKVPVIIHVNDNHRFLKDSINVNEFVDMNIIKEIVLEHFTPFIKMKLEDLKKMSEKQISKLISDKQGNIKEDFKMKFNEVLSVNCIKEILSIGFDINQTFVCRNLKYIGQCAKFYETIITLGSKIAFKEAPLKYKKDFSDDIESISLVSKDISALFAASYPDIFNNETNVRGIVVNLDEKTMSIMRRLAYEMQWPKPVSVTVKPVPSLLGNDTWMDSNTVNSAIFLSDNDKSIKKKIDKFAFSGGKDTIEEHRELGGDCNVDISFQIMRFFMADEERLNNVKEEYGAGRMLTGELKKEAVNLISSLIGGFRENLSKITEGDVQTLMTPRRLNFGSRVVGKKVLEDRENVEEKKEEEVLEVAEEKPKDAGDVVTPWEVSGHVDTGIDYDKLIENYGSNKIGPDLVAKFEEVTGKKAHHLLKRGMFYSHRDFNEILNTHEKGQKFFLYTGRGPSSDALHLGHMIPFIFTKWLQDIFDVPLVIQLTDDEKCLMRNISVEEVQRMAIENVRDIIAVGFDPKKTFIFRDFEYVGQEPAFFETAFRVGAKVNFNSVKAIFGFTEKDSVEKIAFPPIQAAPSFSSSFPAIFRGDHNVRCLIPCAIDQDPYFRMTRDVAPRLNMPKPALIHSRFFPSLQGNQTKMNASDPNSAIFMTDSNKVIADKINHHAFTISEARKPTLTIDEICQFDICYQYLTFFMEDDTKLAAIKQGMQDRSLNTAQLKEELISVLTPVVEAHRIRRELITDEVIREFMTPRALQ